MEGGSRREGGVEALKKLGWGGALAFFDGLAIEEVKKRLGETCSDWGLEEFEELRQEAKRQRLAIDFEENKIAQNPSSGLKDSSWIPRSGNAVGGRKVFGIEMERARALLPRIAWPTRYAGRMHHAQEDAQREKIEEEERDRQIKKLVELLKKANLITDEDKKGATSSTWMLRRRAMGRRVNTLRAHVRMGCRMQEFASAALGVQWFRNPGEVMDFIASRLEEPCGKSVPCSIFSALKFLETSAEVPREKRLSEDEALKNFMSEIEKSHWWVSREKVSANRWVLAVVLCMEFLVVMPEESLYIRLYAWFKLVKLWGMLRWSDTLGIPAARVRYFEGEGLVGEVVRSKTSGVGRRVEVQSFYVSEKAWFLAEGWLKTGFEIFERFGKEARMERRDFMMARPNGGLDGFRASMVSYSDAMSMSRAILRELRAQLRSGGALESLIIDDEVGSFWSEHSERVTMASWAGALKVKQETIKRWGRWKPSVDEEYVKTTKKMVMEAQVQIADQVKSQGLRQDILGEEEVFRGLEERLKERGVREEKISQQMRRLRFQQKAHREVMVGAVEANRDRGSQRAGAPPTSPGDSEIGELDLEEWEAEMPDEIVEVGIGTFVMSIVGRSKKRTLHCVGSCYRRPGHDYKDYVVIGDQRPDLKAGERLCGSCFGAKDKAASEAAASEEEDQVVSDESSSTDMLSSDPDENPSDLDI